MPWVVYDIVSLQVGSPVWRIRVAMALAPHLRRTRLCPYLGGRAVIGDASRHCGRSDCSHAHEIWEVALPSVCRDPSHPHYSAGLAWGDWKRCHYFIGQQWDDSTEAMLSEYARFVIPTMLPQWFWLWTWARGKVTPANTVLIHFKSSWDFDYYFRLDGICEVHGARSLRSSERVELEAALARRHMMLDLLAGEHEPWLVRLALESSSPSPPTAPGTSPHAPSSPPPPRAPSSLYRPVSTAASRCGPLPRAENGATSQERALSGKRWRSQKSHREIQRDQPRINPQTS